MSSFRIYKLHEKQCREETWGTRSETFFSSDEEKYLGFGDIVSVSTLTIFPHCYSDGMKLFRNTELINIILNGTVGYQDSAGSVSSFPENTMQILSAGRGLYQMEFNPGNFVLRKVQIGFLPNVINTAPIQTKAIFNLEENLNTFVELVSPRQSSSSLTIKQQAALLLGKFQKDQHIGYQISNKRVGVFVYVVDGSIIINNEVFNSGESCGINEQGDIMIHTASHATVLIIETIMSQEGSENYENIYG